MTTQDHAIKLVSPLRLGGRNAGTVALHDLDLLETVAQYLRFDPQLLA